MITSFEDYKKAYLSPDNNYYGYEFIEQLKYEEREALKKVVESWIEKDVAEGLRIFLDYYGMQVPVDMIKKICMSDLKLAFEIYTKGISDTCQRSILVDTLLRKMEMRSWPTYGDGDKVYHQFLIDLKLRSEQYGIIMREEY